VFANRLVCLCEAESRLKMEIQTAILAAAHVMARQAEEGLRVIDEAMPLTEQIDDNLFEPELWRRRLRLWGLTRPAPRLLSCRASSASAIKAWSGRSRWIAIRRWRIYCLKIPHSWLYQPYVSPGQIKKKPQRFPL
jgi:hypothetical protein